MARLSPSETLIDGDIHGFLLKNGYYGHLGLHVIQDEDSTSECLEDCDAISTCGSIVVAPSDSSFIFEEENSSDDFPAIGHLDSFEIKRADDGTILPSTVNAKMADGSHQRLTLYPQLEDGKVTFTVQFENFNQEKPTELSQDAILNKIDQLILQNDGIVNGKRHRPIPSKISSAKMLSRPSILPARKRPKSKDPSQMAANISNLFSQPVEKRRCLVPQVPELKPIGTSVLKQTLLEQPVRSKVAPVPEEVQVRNSLNAVSSDQLLKKRLLSMGTLMSTSTPPIEKRAGPLGASTVKIPIKTASSQNIKRRESDVKVPVTPVLENKDIFIQSRPIAPKPSNKAGRLGSTSNPYTFVQDGQKYLSQQPLNDALLEQINAVFNKHSNNLLTNKDSLVIDSEENIRIIYKVISPDKNPVEQKEKTILVPKGKRGRKVKLAAEGRDKSKENLNPPPSTEADKACDENSKNTQKKGITRPLKVVQLSRTRSGRLSKPPQHIIKDYKGIDVGPEETTSKDLSVMDYQSAETNPPPPSATPTVPLNQYINHRTLKTWNVKSDYRCPTCKKVYLGHKRMMAHLKKFPHHSNLSEYTRNLNQMPTVKPLKKKRKMIRMVSKMERGAFGPILAKAFTSWEFMLLRVGLMEKDGTNEVDLILTELNALLDRLRVIFEELLVPVYENESDLKDEICVNLNKLDIAYLLGLAQGPYKVKKELLHMLRLEEITPTPPQEPKDITPCPPPLPDTPQLATKFEPNLSTKLMECSNDSIDLDCSSKDIDNEDEKKEWVPERAEDTSTEFLSEFLESGLPSGAEALTLWKENAQMIQGATPAAAAVDPWKKNQSRTGEQPELWKDGESPFAANNGDLWKRAKAGKGWNEAQNWKRWESGGIAPTRERNKCQESNILWTKDGGNRECEQLSKTYKWEGSALRPWKEDGVNPVPGMPGMRASRLTSTPETASALFSPPHRRNSISGFVPAHPEELLSLDLQELFDDLIPVPTKDDPKPGSIESIINEALFPDNEPPPSHEDIPPLINDTLDEFRFP